MYVGDLAAALLIDAWGCVADALRWWELFVAQRANHLRRHWSACGDWGILIDRSSYQACQLKCKLAKLCPQQAQFSSRSNWAVASHCCGLRSCHRRVGFRWVACPVLSESPCCMWSTQQDRNIPPAQCNCPMTTWSSHPRKRGCQRRCRWGPLGHQGYGIAPCVNADQVGRASVTCRFVCHIISKDRAHILACAVAAVKGGIEHLLAAI